MTQLLQEAIAETSKLPDAQQDAIAQLILNEIASEAKWDDSFSRSHDLLKKMATEALTEDEAGLTTGLNPCEH